MPARPRTSDAQIVRATRCLVESRGRDGFPMSDVAAAVGIRAPSLYGRFKDRASLLGAVELEVCAELAAAVAAAGESAAGIGPEHTLLAQAQAVRRFAQANPNGYLMLFDARAVPTPEGTVARASALAPLMPSLAALAGEARALAAARVLAPFMHGFIAMELAHAFRLGPGLDEAYDTGVATILRGLIHRPGLDAEGYQY